MHLQICLLVLLSTTNILTNVMFISISELLHLYMTNISAGGCQHHWSSFIWEVVRTFMGFKRVIKVHLCCQLLNCCLCLHDCYCAVLYNSARDLPVSTVFLLSLQITSLTFHISSSLGVLTTCFFSYTPLSGFYGVLSGLLVGIKQLLPDQELNLFVLKIKAKVSLFEYQYSNPNFMLLLMFANDLIFSGYSGFHLLLH